jgi:hypothetical protein
LGNQEACLKVNGLDLSGLTAITSGLKIDCHPYGAEKNVHSAEHPLRFAARGFNLKSAEAQPSIQGQLP